MPRAAKDTKATKATKAPKTAKAAKKTGSLEFKNFEPYKPKRGEKYMNEQQRAHFRGILLNWKSDLMQEVDRTVSHMKDEAANFPDPADRATQEEEFSLELRTRDRERKLIKKIDSARPAVWKSASSGWKRGRLRPSASTAKHWRKSRNGRKWAKPATAVHGA